MVSKGADASKSPSTLLNLSVTLQPLTLISLHLEASQTTTQLSASIPPGSIKLKDTVRYEIHRFWQSCASHPYSFTCLFIYTRMSTSFFHIAPTHTQFCLTTGFRLFPMMTSAILRTHADTSITPFLVFILELKPFCFINSAWQTVCLS